MSRGADILGASLHEIFRNHYIASEYSIKAGRATLRFDYFIPKLNMAFEYDGSQHQSYNHFFHQTRRGFREYQTRDRIKEDWCKSNNVTLIRIPHWEIPTVEFLRKRILDTCSLP